MRFDKKSPGGFHRDKFYFFFSNADQKRTIYFATTLPFMVRVTVEETALEITVIVLLN